MITDNNENKLITLEMTVCTNLKTDMELTLLLR